MNCHNCNKAFLFKYRNRIYCSKACKQAAYMKRLRKPVTDQLDLGDKKLVTDRFKNQSVTGKEFVSNTNTGTRIVPVNNPKPVSDQLKANPKMLSRLLSILDRAIHLSLQPSVSEEDVKAVYRALESVLESQESKESGIDPTWLDDLDNLLLELCRFSIKPLNPSQGKFNMGAGLRGRLVTLVNNLQSFVKRQPFSDF